MSETKSIETFIDENRDEIDAIIVDRLGKKPWGEELTDEDREDWVANDESLYLWAIEEGVTDV